MTTDHRSSYRAKIEASLKVDEQHLARLRHLLEAAQNRLATAPDNPIRSYQAQELATLIAMSEEKIATLRRTLQEIVPERDEDRM